MTDEQRHAARRHRPVRRRRRSTTTSCERDREQAFSRELWQQVRRDRHPGPARAGRVRRQRSRCAVLRDRASRRSATVAVTAGWSSPCAHICCRAWFPCGSIGNDEQKRRYLPGLCDGNADRRARDDRAGFGLGRLRASHARGSRRRGLPHQRNEDVHFERSRGRPRHRVRRHRPRQGVPRRRDRVSRGARHAGVLVPAPSSRRWDCAPSPIGELVFEDVVVGSATRSSPVLAPDRESSRPRWTGNASASCASHIGARRVRLIVFLHEGLGSIAMWKRLPGVSRRATGCNALVYSRIGTEDPTRLPRRIASASCTTRRRSSFPNCWTGWASPPDTDGTQRRGLDRADSRRRRVVRSPA